MCSINHLLQAGPSRNTTGKHCLLLLPQYCCTAIRTYITYDTYWRRLMCHAGWRSLQDESEATILDSRQRNTLDP